MLFILFGKERSRVLEEDNFSDKKCKFLKG